MRIFLTILVAITIGTSVACAAKAAELATQIPPTVAVSIPTFEALITAPPLVITVVVTATPGPTPEPTPVPSPTAAPTPYPTPEPLPTYAPLPTSIPEVVYETVIETVEVEVIITATPTQTPMPTATTTAVPTSTPVPTATPIPTATTIPPFVQNSAGSGSWLSDAFTFWNERPIIIDVRVSGEGLFILNAVTPTGCVVEVSSGQAPFDARTIAEPNIALECDGTRQFGTGTKFAVAAGAGVGWHIDLTQSSQPVRQVPPFTASGAGQDIFGPMLIGDTDMVVVLSAGETPFKLEAYSIYELEPYIETVVDVNSGAFGNWYINVPIGTYIIAIDTEQDRAWEVEVKHR